MPSPSKFPAPHSQGEVWSVRGGVFQVIARTARKADVMNRAKMSAPGPHSAGSTEPHGDPLILDMEIPGLMWTLSISFLSRTEREPLSLQYLICKEVHLDPGPAST